MKKLFITFLLVIIPSYVVAQTAEDTPPETPSTPPTESTSEKDTIGIDLIQQASSDELGPTTNAEAIQDPGMEGMCISDNGDEDEDGYLPLSFVIHYTFNSLWRKKPGKKPMKLGFWGSSQLGVTLFYDVQIGNSNFFVSPGIGIAWNSYRFRNLYVPKRRAKTGKIFMKKAVDEVDPILSERKKNDKEEDKKKTEAKQKENAINRSSLRVSYADIFNLEFRYHKKPKRYKEAFFISLGLKMGVRMSTSTRISYQEHDQSKSRIQSDTFHLSKIRYGLYSRVGIGRFGIYFDYILSNLVIKDKWEDGVDMRPWSLGLSLDLF